MNERPDTSLKRSFEVLDECVVGMEMMWLSNMDASYGEPRDFVEKLKSVIARVLEESPEQEKNMIQITNFVVHLLIFANASQLHHANEFDRQRNERKTRPARDEKSKKKALWTNILFQGAEEELTTSLPKLKNWLDWAEAKSDFKKKVQKRFHKEWGRQNAHNPKYRRYELDTISRRLEEWITAEALRRLNEHFTANMKDA